MNNLDISYRLQRIAKRVKYRTLADVGTDHAYLPAFLCLDGRLDFAVASDINKKPLERAADTVKKYGLEDKIDIRLGPGLSAVSAGECETLVMAGMGGMLTIGVLNDNLKTAKSFKQLVLQPQRDLKEVRIFLTENGFVIDDEEMLADGGKYYNILDCTAGESERYTGEEYYFGRALIRKKDEILKRYIVGEIGKANGILDGIRERKNALKRAAELEKYLEMCGEVLKWL